MQHLFFNPTCSYPHFDEIVHLFNPISPGLFSRSPGLGGGGGGGGRGLRGPDAKNQGYHKSIEIKLCLSHYIHRSIPDEKFESVSFSIVGDMKSQNFILERKQVIEFRYLPQETEFNF